MRLGTAVDKIFRMFQKHHQVHWMVMNRGLVLRRLLDVPGIPENYKSHWRWYWHWHDWKLGVAKTSIAIVISGLVSSAPSSSDKVRSSSDSLLLREAIMRISAVAISVTLVNKSRQKST